VERITADHAGTLAIRTEPNVGTTVTITIPTMHQQAHDSKSVAAPAS
jgi:signal transduction histidine kinase